MRSNTLFIAIYCCAFFNCSSSDEGIQDGLKLAGVVLETLECDSPNGQAIQVKIENNNTIDTLTTVTLPDSLREKGLRISFQIRESSESLICNTSILPPRHVYNIYNINRE